MLENKVALVTGAAKGIGRAIALRLAEDKAAVIVNYNGSKERAEEVVKMITDMGGRAESYQCNVADDEACQTMIRDIIKKYGHLDILVNNAGILQGGAFGSVSENDYNMTLDTNLKGTYFLSQIMANYMKTNKIPGNILNIASSSSLRPAISPYTITKWGIRGLTLGLAKALIPYGIVVNGLAPGPTATPLLVKDGYNGIEHAPSLPAGRYVTAEEIANMAVILVSSCGKMIIGDIIYMTGGAGTITVDDVPYTF